MQWYQMDLVNNCTREKCLATGGPAEFAHGLLHEGGISVGDMVDVMRSVRWNPWKLCGFRHSLPGTDEARKVFIKVRDT